MNGPKIKKLILCHIPVSICNLQCEYCYISQLDCRRKNIMPEFQYSSYIGKALSVERLGGVCLLNLCGAGETLLPQEVPKIIKQLLAQGHFLEVVTNGTMTKRFEEIIQFPYESLKRLEFKFSFHYLELLRLGKIDVFFNNIKLIKKAGCSFTVELVAYDNAMSHIENIKAICKEKLGALCHLTVARNDANHQDYLTRLSKEEYINTWDTFKSEMFDFKLSTFGIRRKEYCYAGDWILYVNLDNGDATQCYCSRFRQNIFKNINKPITFLPVGKNCTLPHCYNSHAFLTLGAIPELKTITYANIRNRICDDGTEWLKPDVKEFLNGKFIDNNKLYGLTEKMKKEIHIRAIIFQSNILNVKRRVIRKLHAFSGTEDQSG